MNAPCALHSIAVRVEEKRVVLLQRPGSAERIAAIKPEFGRQKCLTIEVEGAMWLIINHPAHGLLGLPLNGTVRSWHAEWENMNITLEVCTKNGWEEVHDWNRLLAEVAPH